MHTFLSQNKKIAISAAVVFVLSFIMMIVFLSYNSSLGVHGKTDVFHIDGFEDMEGAESFDTYDDDKVPTFVTSSDAMIEYMNGSFCDLLDTNCNKVIGESLFDYFKTDDNSSLIENYTKLIQEGESIEGMGPVVIESEHSEKLVLLNAEPALDEEGKVIYLIFKVKDITKQAESLK